MPFSVLLIRPPSMTGNTFSRVSGIMLPLNLVYIATYLKKQNETEKTAVRVSILDLELDPSCFHCLRKYIVADPPDLVGITAHTNNMPAAAAISRVVKGVLPRCKVVLGGPHPTVEPEKSLEYVNAVDFIVCGEGEQSFYEIVKELREPCPVIKKIPGIYYRDADTGRISFTGRRDGFIDLAQLSPPDVGLVDIERYLKIPQSPGIWKRTWNMFTQRGCAYDCSFCASPKIHEYKVRLLPVSSVINEIKNAIMNFGIEHVNFRDSNFSMSRARTIDICHEIVRQKLKITWNCETRVNLVDPGLLKIMRSAGCTKISFGVESGSPRILKQISKKVNLAQIKDAFAWCKDAGIQTQAYFMIGFPTETRVDIGLTMGLIKSISPDFLFVSIVVPLPGSRIFNEFMDRGLMSEPDRYETFQFFYHAPSWRTTHHDMDDLVRIQRAVYSNYVLSPGYIIRMVKQIRGISQLRYYFGAILGFIGFLFKRGKE